MFATHKLMGAGGAGGAEYYFRTTDAGTVTFQVAPTSSSGLIAMRDKILGVGKSGNPDIRQTLSGATGPGGLDVNADGTLVAFGIGPASSTKVYAAKLNSTATSISWQKEFSIPTSSSSENFAGRVDGSGNLYYGAAIGANPTYNMQLAAKFDSSGSLLWSRLLSQSTYYFGFIGNNLPAPSGDAYFVSTLYFKVGTVNEFGRALIMRLSSTGTTIWATQVGNAGATGANGPYIQIASACADSSGNVFALGIYSGRNSGTTNSFICKLNSSGSVLWQREIVTSGNTNQGYGKNRLATDSLGNVYCLTNNNNTTFFMTKIDSSGSLVWQRTISSTSRLNIAVTQDDTLLLSGGGFVARLPSDGTGAGTYGGITYASTSLVSLTTTAFTTGAATVVNNSAGSTASTSTGLSLASYTEVGTTYIV